MNIQSKIDGDTLTVTVDLSRTAIETAPLSSSGKTRLVATTHGALLLEQVHGRQLLLSLNVMAK
jgi:hypothetical protein